MKVYELVEILQDMPQNADLRLIKTSDSTMMELQVFIDSVEKSTKYDEVIINLI